ncbi:MAG: NAD-dependent epimerase/dehydratase family protein [Deltaproteobacteria bacterium]|nr:NAD-dependent epimerase/dehydratase family protein [Deltaproteobacteria bacterium]
MAKRRPLILVTGATGAVGPAVVEAFHAAGYSIRTLSIDSPPAGTWPDDVETLIGDVTDVSAVRAAMQGAESVVHLAALLHIANPAPALQDQYERINVGGTSNVIAAAIRAGVGRVVLFSTIAVYGPSGGRILTEDTPPYPNTVYARTKLAAEKIVLEARGVDGGQIGVALRLGAVYGFRIKGNYQRLVQSLARGRFIPVGNGFNRRTLVYDTDVARAAVLAVGHDSAAGRIFNVSDGRFHTMDEIIRTICDALGRPPPGFALPVSLARWAAGLLEESFKLFGFRSPVTRGIVDTYMEDIAVDSQRIQNELGFVPRYDLAAGWKETVKASTWL